MVYDEDMLLTSLMKQIKLNVNQTYIDNVIRGFDASVWPDSAHSRDH